MKSTTLTILAYASIGSTAPAPQFSVPSFSIPSFSFPGGELPTGLPSLSIGAGVGLPTTALAAATSAGAAQPTTSIPADANENSSCTVRGAGGGSTENGVADQNCCTNITVIFARGTSETGNVGTVAGPPMFKSLRSKLGADMITVQGVDYPADVAGNANLGASGGPAMASSIKSALSQCPNTKVVVSGYSQGAMVVHNAFSAQGITASQVKGAVLFGDPFNPQAVQGLSTDDTKEFCASGDAVCNGGGFTITPAHLTYGDDADAAASAVIQFAGLS